jgi:hypothetical protein
MEQKKAEEIQKNIMLQKFNDMANQKALYHPNLSGGTNSSSKIKTATVATNSNNIKPTTITTNKGLTTTKSTPPPPTTNKNNSNDDDDDDEIDWDNEP